MPPAPDTTSVSSVSVRLVCSFSRAPQTFMLVETKQTDADPKRRATRDHPLELYYEREPRMTPLARIRDLCNNPDKTWGVGNATFNDSRGSTRPLELLSNLDVLLTMPDRVVTVNMVNVPKRSPPRGRQVKSELSGCAWPASATTPATAPAPAPAPAPPAPASAPAPAAPAAPCVLPAGLPHDREAAASLAAPAPAPATAGEDAGAGAGSGAFPFRSVPRHDATFLTLLRTLQSATKLVTNNELPCKVLAITAMHTEYVMVEAWMESLGCGHPDYDADSACHVWTLENRSRLYVACANRQTNSKITLCLAMAAMSVFPGVNSDGYHGNGRDAVILIGISGSLSPDHVPICSVVNVTQIMLLSGGMEFVKVVAEGTDGILEQPDNGDEGAGDGEEGKEDAERKKDANRTTYCRALVGSVFADSVEIEGSKLQRLNWRHNRLKNRPVFLFFPS